MTSVESGTTFNHASQAFCGSRKPGEENEDLLSGYVNLYHSHHCTNNAFTECLHPLKQSHLSTYRPIIILNAQVSALRCDKETHSNWQIKLRLDVLLKKAPSGVMDHGARREKAIAEDQVCTSRDRMLDKTVFFPRRSLWGALDSPGFRRSHAGAVVLSAQD